MANPTRSDNLYQPIIIGGPVVLNAVSEIIAQDASSIMPAGTVLGRINVSTGVAAAISISTAGNTGTGAVTMDATAPCQLGARAGIHTVYFTGATSGYVTGPDGFQIGAAFAALPNPWTQQLKFVVSGTPVSGDKIAITIPSVVQSNGTHNGSGVITMDATTPVLYGVKPGSYSITFTGSAAGYLLDPNGNLVGPAFASLPNPWSNQLKFVISGTPQAGDVSYIFVTAGTGKLKRFVSTNFDGSQIPVYIALGAIDATAGDVTIGVQGSGNSGSAGLLKEGQVNPNALILQNEPLQSYVPQQNMKVIDILLQAGFDVQAGGNLSTFDN